ncbi:nodulation protein NfeD [Spirochaetota bacterium]
MKKKITGTLLFAFIISSIAIAGFGADKYAVLKIDGSINPVVSRYISESINKAENDNAQFVVIQMDTPGGNVDSTREIIKAIFASKIPVVVFTYPKGARAASAGGFIMLSAHIAVMAPGTEIGAMHPVSPQLDFLKKDKKGRPAGVMEKKVLNDLVAYARSIAQKRNRNSKWAVKAVKEAISNTYKEAKKLKIIDFIAEDMDDLLKKLNGRVITFKEGKKTRRVAMKTRSIRPIYYKMDWKQRFLNFFADPSVFYLLILVAMVGIGMEIKNPGMVAPGVAGGVALILVLMVRQVIPINIIGLILIFLAVVLFILELKIVSYGLLTIGGIVSFVLGSMIIFDSPLPGGHVPMTTIVVTVIIVLAFIFIVVRAVLSVHKSKATTGKIGLIGEVGTAIRDFKGKGKIRIHGEIWDAYSEDGVLKDEEVVVKEVDGMKLIVERKDD